MDKLAPQARFNGVWLDDDVHDLTAAVTRETSLDDWPRASEVQSRIPIYDGEAVRDAAGSAPSRKALMAEWATLFQDGPGVLVIRDAVPADVVAEATALFDRLIAAEKDAGQGGGDHFAKPGANDRLWNSAEKHCRADPAGFLRYYASDAIALASEAWLGPDYQLTAQVNRVNPGGAAQTPHRDYHLGFMDKARAAAFPAQSHRLSPALTLQGAIAHGEMPVESGPTMLLPYSQTVENGYLSFGTDAAQAIFADHHVQLPLSVGDAVFFNPALMHGAGTNRTKDVQRMANLLQVSSAFGRAIEAVDRAAMCRALFPVLSDLKGALGPRGTANAIAAAAEGYAYPTDLDTDPPVGGLAPQSQSQLLKAALADGLSAAAFDDVMRDWALRRQGVPTP